IGDFDFCDKCELGSILVCPVETYLAAKPSIGQRRSDDVGSGLHQIRDIVGLRLNPCVVVRPTWREELVARFLAIDGYLVETLSRRIDAGGGDCGSSHELAPQQWKRSGATATGSGDPIRPCPIGHCKQACLEPGRAAPVTCVSCRIPNSNLPIVARSGLKLNARGQRDG